MMIYSRSDLENMYESPSPEFTERVRLSVAALPSREQEDKIMKKRMPLTLIIAAVALIVFSAAAYAAVTLYRVVNWRAEVTRTAEPAPTAAAEAGQNGQDKAQEDLRFFMLGLPDDETVYAWVEDERGGYLIGDLHAKRKVFASAERLSDAMAGARDLTLPVWLPEGEEAFFSAETEMDCRAFGKYNALGSGRKGPIRYERYLIGDEDAVISGYSLTLTLEDGSSWSVMSRLCAPPAAEEAIALREGETAEQVRVPGMDEAILIRASDPKYPDGLLMRRTLEEPVRWKRLPLGGQEEDDDNVYTHEQLTVWAFGVSEPEELLKLFGGK